LVDEILSCPPFGRQFPKESANLFRNCCKNVQGDTGRMVLVVDMYNFKDIVDASQKANCAVNFCRSPSRLGKIRATIVVVTKRKSEKRMGTSIRKLWLGSRRAQRPSVMGSIEVTCCTIPRTLHHSKGRRKKYATSPETKNVHVIDAYRFGPFSLTM
jgi:hypothetical protein